ncbi:MAG: alpha/beta hydrolase, partial [Marinobacter sp.]|nr:alpha/beta hydrolase [Marinobacter sp.]
MRIQVLFLSVLTVFTCIAKADYANINGIDMYYEIHGEGTPLVMLHGGYTDSDVWTIATGFLANSFQVIEIDRRGHGRTTDGGGPITYELMADDTLKLLDEFGIPNAHFAGWSDGAVIAAHIAAFHP